MNLVGVWLVGKRIGMFNRLLSSGSSCLRELLFKRPCTLLDTASFEQLGKTCTLAGIKL
jgi:hypothetical protein